MGSRALRLVALAGVVGLTAAGCPNGCNKNGECSQNDICTCNSLWMGPDCSQRTCLYGPAWAADNSDPHAVVECANQGACNRVTGECECFDGFEGRACTRMSCPNKCSGNGICKKLKDLNTTVPYSASNWDADRIGGCLCDPGYYGVDCSLRYCPTGDDPLTLCASTNRNHVQEIKFILGSYTKHDFSAGDDSSMGGISYINTDETMEIFGVSGGLTGSSFASIRNEPNNFHFKLNFVDQYGAAWTTHGVDYVMATNAGTGNVNARDAIERALETLPNNKVKDVVVTTNLDTSISTAVYTRRYLVTFVADATSSVNVGLQNTMEVPNGYSCAYTGCSPVVKMPFLYRYCAAQGATLDVAETALGTTAATIKCYTGDENTQANFVAGKFLRLHPDSYPQMPPGIAVDTAISSAAAYQKRYDMRIVVAVVDPKGDASDTAVDVYYTRVIIGHDNIMSDSERIGLQAPYNGPFSTNPAYSMYPSLNGFTYQGQIPASYEKLALAGAPGVYISFPERDIVSTDTYMRMYEIMIKLPHATVTPVTAEEQVHTIDGIGWEEPVDIEVENIECSGRGTCDRSLGTCACYQGYTGVACHTQSAVV